MAEPGRLFDDLSRVASGALGSLYEPFAALDTPYLYRDVDHLKIQAAIANHPPHPDHCTLAADRYRHAGIGQPHLCRCAFMRTETGKRAQPQIIVKRRHRIAQIEAGNIHARVVGTPSGA